jgi:hypothetical protein
MILPVDQSSSPSTADENRDGREQPSQQPIAIERTSKQFKFGMIVGFLMMLFGVCATVNSVYLFIQNYDRLPETFAELANDQKPVYVSLFSIALGFIVYHFERFLAWWNNG